MSKIVRPITPDEVATYHEAGFVCLRGVLDLQTVNSIRRCIDQTVSTLGESKAGYDFTQLVKAFQQSDQQTLDAQSDGQHDVAGILDYVRRSGDRLLLDENSDERKGSFLADSGVSSRIKEFRRLVTRGPGAEIAGALLGSSEVRFYGDQVFVKEPQTEGRTAYHQDASYFEIDGYDCCVLWIPVDPVTLETGAMRYVRGSHKDGKNYKPNTFVTQTPLPGAQGETLPDIEANEDAYDIVHFDAEPGDIIVHHYKTIHGTGGNMSRYQVRRAASIRYTGDDIRFVERPWTPRQLHHTHKLKHSDALSGADFPVVWRRPDIQKAA